MPIYMCRWRTVTFIRISYVERCAIWRSMKSAHNCRNALRSNSVRFI